MHLLAVDKKNDAFERRRLRHELKLITRHHHLDAPATELEVSGHGEESTLTAVLGEQHLAAAGRRLGCVERQDDWRAVER